MNEQFPSHDGRVTAGRKGVPYDWQAVLASRAAATIPSDAAAIEPVLVGAGR